MKIASFLVFVSSSCFGSIAFAQAAEPTHRPSTAQASQSFSGASFAIGKAFYAASIPGGSTLIACHYSSTSGPAAREYRLTGGKKVTHLGERWSSMAGGIWYCDSSTPSGCKFTIS